MKLRVALASVVMALGVFGATCASAAHYVYVGQWAVGDGPSWASNPLAYSGVGYAAFAWGGSASDYAISTVDSNPAHIDHQAHYDMIGVGPGVFADNYFRGTEGATYYQDVWIDDPAVDTLSTYVNDFGGDTSINYAFRLVGVPEPATWALMMVGFGGLGLVMRSRRKLATAAA